MDAERTSLASLKALEPYIDAGLPQSMRSLRKPGAGMATAEVVPLHKQDPALQEERRVAADLVRRIRNGDQSAESSLVERYSDGLRYLLLRRVRDDERARDLLQDTLHIAINKLRDVGLDNPERLAGYLRGIAIRVALNAGRRQQREPYSMEVEAVEQIPDREPRQFDHVAQEQTKAAVHKLLRSMPVKRDREILTRFYVRDQDKDEICSALGLDSLHFNRVLFRAKKRFRKLLENTATIADFVTERDG